VSIITPDYLPAAVAADELIDALLDGANAQAIRVAPCLPDPTAVEWAATTAYEVGDQVKVAEQQFLEVTVAGTSGGTAPTVPALRETVTDGTVTWKRISPTADQLAEARLVLIGAVKRWAEAGAGALQSETVGPFSRTIDTRRNTGYRLWPSEIEQLQAICQQSTSSAFSVDTAPCSSVHADICALRFGATYCSCGADIAGFPLYETCD
jgi:hypothetical protein